MPLRSQYRTEVRVRYLRSGGKSVTSAIILPVAPCCLPAEIPSAAWPFLRVAIIVSIDGASTGSVPKPVWTGLITMPISMRLQSVKRVEDCTKGITRRRWLEEAAAASAIMGIRRSNLVFPCGRRDRADSLCYRRVAHFLDLSPSPLERPSYSVSFRFPADTGPYRPWPPLNIPTGVEAPLILR